MPDGNSVERKNAWAGVGVHPTPPALVRGFARAVSAAVIRRHQPGVALNVLDACAGDGRLGHAVAKRLARLGFQPKLTLVEADVRRIGSHSTSYEAEQVVGDFYAFQPSRSFDVVVSNPPYLALSRAEADRLNLEWSHVIDCGRNLYSLALAKCLSICNIQGIVGLLAPHGWVRNWYGNGLRARINCEVERVDIYASSSRRLFPGVHQDVAAQVFELRSMRVEGANASVRISYDHSAFDSIVLPTRPVAPRQDTERVRVGPFVWNREKDLLSVRAFGLPVVYGGNITSDGRLDLKVPRYRGRQFVAKSRVPLGYITRGSCLLIKRSLRGGPGDWKLDAALLNDAPPFVAENHVIVIEFSKQPDREKISRMCSEIVRTIERDHRHHGHPNVSVSIVRHALAMCEQE
jgi:predicted RNA methylase